MALDDLTGSIAFTMTATPVDTPTGLADTTNNFTFNKSHSFTLGTGAGTANQFYAALRTLSGGASETIDLNGSLTDLVGNTSILVDNICGMAIMLLSASDTAPDGETVGTACTGITIGAAGSNPFVGPLGGTAPTITLPSGGWIAFARSDATGWSSAAGSADNLQVVNNDGAVAAKYLIGFFGRDT